MKNELVVFLFELFLILLATKSLGLLMRKLGLPQILGFIIAGILVGGAIWLPLFNWEGSAVFPIRQNNYLDAFAEVGALLVMFTAGLETDLKEMKKVGFLSFMVALGGVLIPFGLGFFAGKLFIHESTVYENIVLGVVLTATSVGITVETLKELGKLKGKVGTVIMSAAVIDDVIGIIALTLVISLSGNSSESLLNPNGNIFVDIILIVAFFIVSIVGGIIISKIFKRLEKNHPRTRRLSIYSLAICFLFAFLAEMFFNVADITGAYVAGIVLSLNHNSAEYVDKKLSVNSYTIFAPIFFAYIGIKISFDGFGSELLLFTLIYTLVAIIGKIIGCGGVALISKNSLKDSLGIGVGMVARGEVALIVVEKAGEVVSAFTPAVVIMVLATSILPPILLKLIYRNDTQNINKPLTENLDTEQTKT